MNNNECKSEINSEGYNERKKVIAIVEKRVIKIGYGYNIRQKADENQPAMMFYGFLKEFWGKWGNKHYKVI